MDLNLSDWIEHRFEDAGPYKREILRGVKEYEAEIERLNSLLSKWVDLGERTAKEYTLSIDANRLVDFRQAIRETKAAIDLNTPHGN